MKVWLRVVDGPDRGREFSFETRDRFVIGRVPTAHFQITADPFFSRVHAVVEVDPPNVMVQDLKSTNGTYVNGARIAGPTPINPGDSIGGGKTRIVMSLEETPVRPTPLPITAASMPPKTTPKPTLVFGSGAGEFAPPPPPPSLPSNDRVAVTCLRCGAPYGGSSRPRADDAVYFCAPCQEQMLAKPELGDGYTVVKELGRGGMGAVYLAQHAVLGRRAIKMILPKAAMSHRIRSMFVREASSQAMLDHPRIVRVLDFREASRGIFCMVMELVDGPSAEALVTDRPTGIDQKLAAQIIAQALEGLGHAHAKGIVHRDIKDANILLGRDERGQLAVKLSDFGLAKSYETSGASGFTKTGDISGTVPYMAPEQILNFRDVRPPADLYSMGATLYHLLTGRLPYAFRPEADPLVQILEEPIVDPRQRNPTISEAMARVVGIAMQKDPVSRFRTAEDMRQALLAAV